MTREEFRNSIRVENAEEGQKAALEAYHAGQSESENKAEDGGREIGDESGPGIQGRSPELKSGGQNNEENANDENTSGSFLLSLYETLNEESVVDNTTIQNDEINSEGNVIAPDHTTNDDDHEM